MLWKLLPRFFPESGRLGNADDAVYSRFAFCGGKMLFYFQSWNQIANDDLLYAKKSARCYASAVQAQSLMGNINE